ncbi:hypothetical protein [Brotaphodocola sp.]|uniref:hypothetical protein n=1 Tax=Brotaphodocola sp. TaxID=3073577 RepID=UPI003D7E2821
MKEREMSDVFSKERIITYLWLIFFPPCGLFRVWKKESAFHRSEKWVWTMIEIAYIVYFLQMTIFA